MDIVLQAEQQGGKPSQTAPDRRSDQIELFRIHTHQNHHLAILGDGPNRRAEIGAGQEEVEHDHPDESRAESQQTGKTDVHLEDVEDRQAQPDIAKLGAERQRGKTLQEKQQAAGGQELVDRRRVDNGRDDQLVHQ